VFRSEKVQKIKSAISIQSRIIHSVSKNEPDYMNLKSEKQRIQK